MFLSFYSHVPFIFPTIFPLCSFHFLASSFSFHFMFLPFRFMSVRFPFISFSQQEYSKCMVDMLTSPKKNSTNSSPASRNLLFEISQENPDILSARVPVYIWILVFLLNIFESLRGSKCCILQANAGFQMQILAIVRCYDPTSYQPSWVFLVRIFERFRRF